MEATRVAFVLKHAQTSQIFTCVQVNHYNLAYYGTKYWDYEDEAADQCAAFLQSQDVADPEQWQVAEYEENRIKIFNVKLKNDPETLLFVDELGRITTVKR
jgi:hypothetical protein